MPASSRSSVSKTSQPDTSGSYHDRKRLRKRTTAPMAAMTGPASVLRGTHRMVARRRRTAPPSAPLPSCAVSEQRRMALRGLHHLTAIVPRPRSHDRVLPRRARPRARAARAPATTIPTRATSGSRSAARRRSGQPHLVPRVPVDGARARRHRHRSSTSRSSSSRPRSRRPGATTCARRGVQCTEVFERGGFRSIYIRDPDNHIVEIATRGPGLPRVPGARSVRPPWPPVPSWRARTRERGDALLAPDVPPRRPCSRAALSARR